MSETKWTPGPWSYRGSLGPASNQYLKGPHIVESASGNQIAIMNGWRSDVSEANACLIAAAPDLYAALAAICDEDCIDMARLTAGKAALRKARGESA